MPIRIGVAILLCTMVYSTALAQTVRFQTNVGSFDMMLNPTNDPNLQPLVDNIVAYVGLGRYHFSAINRAADGDASDPADDFVLQMGGFLGFPPVPELFAGFTTPVQSFSPIVVDADGDGMVDFNSLSNSRSTVSLALSAGNVNSGSNSFFVNLGENTFLDDQGFVPFAKIRDMATIDHIMGLMQTDISDAVGDSGNLAFVDVPMLENGRMVVVTDVTVIEVDETFSFVGPIATALQLAQRTPSPSVDLPVESSSSVMPSSADESLLPFAIPSISPKAISVPEPSGLAVAGLGLLSLAALRFRFRCRQTSSGPAVRWRSRA